MRQNTGAERDKSLEKKKQPKYFFNFKKLQRLNFSLCLFLSVTLSFLNSLSLSLCTYYKCCYCKPTVFQYSISIPLMPSVYCDIFAERQSVQQTLRWDYLQQCSPVQLKPLTPPKCCFKQSAPFQFKVFIFSMEVRPWSPQQRNESFFDTHKV